MPPHKLSWIAVVIRAYRAVFTLWLGATPMVFCPIPRQELNLNYSRGIER